MAVQPFINVPRGFTAGDTLSLLLSCPQFPASDGWQITIKAVIQGTATLLTLGPSTPSGDQHSILVTAATTAGWAPGSYRWQARAAKGAEVYTVDGGDLQVFPALAANVDSRSFEEKMLAAVEAALLAMGTDSVIQYRIGDREARRYTRVELLKERAAYRAAVRRQKGQPLIRLIPTEFQSGKTIVPEPGALDIPFV